MGDYWVNDDGSMDRIVPIPEEIKSEAKQRGISLKPDHIPAEQVQRYESLKDVVRPSDAVRGRKDIAMDAILFSAKRGMVDVDDAIRHLQEHSQLYWSVGFRITRAQFRFPILGFIHITGGQVEYQVTINDIIRYADLHHEDPAYKPAEWRSADQLHARDWRNTFIISKIEPFSIQTTALRKVDGTPVQKAPQGYAHIIPPTAEQATASWLAKAHVPEKHLEAVVLHNLGKIEPGLTLVKQQIETPAGRIDLLCKDSAGRSVVIELKRSQGTDRVVGQILRYVGYLSEKEGADNVRGIIIVQTRDPRLSYAVKATKNIQVREFEINFSF